MVVSTDARNSHPRADTVLVSVGAANPEIGTVQPLKEIGRVIRRPRNDTARVRSRGPCRLALSRAAASVQAVQLMVQVRH